TADVAEYGPEVQRYRDQLEGRSMIVLKTEPLPVECVVRGYIAGSGWKDYRATGAVCGIPLPAGLQESQRLDPPLFTPSTKAETLPPASSRFWPRDGYTPGRAQPSFDKQYVRDYLETLAWDKRPPGPALPAEVVERTRDKYLDAYARLTGAELPVVFGPASTR